MFSYSNAPKNPNWHRTKDANYEYCISFDAEGGYFLGIRDSRTGEMLKEHFYVHPIGARKALQRFMFNKRPDLYRKP